MLIETKIPKNQPFQYMVKFQNDSKNKISNSSREN